MTLACTNLCSNITRQVSQRQIIPLVIDEKKTQERNLPAKVFLQAAGLPIVLTLDFKFCTSRPSLPALATYKSPVYLPCNALSKNLHMVGYGLNGVFQLPLAILAGNLFVLCIDANNLKIISSGIITLPTQNKVRET